MDASGLVGALIIGIDPSQAIALEDGCEGEHGWAYGMRPGLSSEEVQQIIERTAVLPTIVRSSSTRFEVHCVVINERWLTGDDGTASRWATRGVAGFDINEVIALRGVCEPRGGSWFLGVPAGSPPERIAEIEDALELR